MGATVRVITDEVERNLLLGRKINELADPTVARARRRIGGLVSSGASGAEEPVIWFRPGISEYDLSRSHRL